jgi:AcrR family transcriptional regulator
MKTKRGYTMTTRAEAVEETRRRILQATFDLTMDRLITDISLDLVAQGAEVSVQTVLRQFGSRDGLFDATLDYANSMIVEERRAPVGDVDAAVRVVMDHYELRGDAAMMMLAQETSETYVMLRVTDRGRKTHRDWVETVFAPYVAGDTSLVDLLVVATDVYTWKLLRRDRRLSRAQTEKRMRTLVAAVLATAPGNGD